MYALVYIDNDMNDKLTKDSWDCVVWIQGHILIYYDLLYISSHSLDYKLMRTHQTLAFTQKMSHKYSFENGPRCKMSIREAFRVLESYVDSSDPDVSLPNLVHMLQTAEGVRRAGHPEWFQVVGLIHDMGKIMFL